MTTHFKRLKRLVTTVCLLLALVTASYYTPIFSSVGLFVLTHLPVPDAATYQTHDNSTLDLDFRMNADNASNPDNQNLLSNPEMNADKPSAYVVLGGGLTEATPRQSPNEWLDDGLPDDEKITNNIVLNKYSLSRVQTALENYNNEPLPIVLTGVESPWMNDWLLNHGVENIITENASMNTCENARFTAKRLHLSHIYLITDPYHMTRARRQFALNGISSVPLRAPLPIQKKWNSPANNKKHSRRTLYELAAYARDIFKPQTNCRSAEDVSFDTLRQSRKPTDLKTF